MRDDPSSLPEWVEPLLRLGLAAAIDPSATPRLLARMDAVLGRPVYLQVRAPDGQWRDTSDRPGTMLVDPQTLQLTDDLRLIAAAGDPPLSELGPVARPVAEAIAASSVQLSAAGPAMLRGHAHDLANVLAVARGLAARLPDNERVRTLTEALDEAAELTTATLLLWRGTLEYGASAGRCDLSKVVDGHARMLRLGQVDRDGRVRVESRTDGRCAVPLSPGQAARVVMNLLSNAFRYASSEVTAEVARGDGGVVCTVHDDGPGFPANLVGPAGTPVERPDGSGIGLSLVRSIVESAGGKVTIEPGPGGHVRLWLPDADEAGGTAAGDGPLTG